MYSSKIYKQPFWAENHGFMTGRDPLGIQNSSITVYGRLLPGMTNLTLRLRYYGFYCWLLDQYYRLPEFGKKSLEFHFNYIRRAELTIAFIMLKLEENQTSIIGSDFSYRNANQIDELGFYKIGEGADKLKSTEKGSVYWDFTSGALGQYYAGSLYSLDLMEPMNGFFRLGQKGKELAIAFSKNISNDAQTRFLKVIEEGILTNDDIKSLQEFAMNRIIFGKEEWRFYVDLLFEDDGERFKTSDGKTSTKRRETILLYLKYISLNLKEQSFQESQYLIVAKGNQQYDASIGWYYYYINEAIHFCVETIFWALLVELDGKVIPVKEFINQIVAVILEKTTSDYECDDSCIVGSIMSSINMGDVIRGLKELEKYTKSAVNSGIALGLAINLIFQIYINIKDRLDLITEFENKNFLQDQKGNISGYVKTLIEDSLHNEYQHYLDKLIKNIINDHISTAYRKMGNGEVNLLKFIIEDGSIGHVQTMPPKYTNPRLQTLHNFLHDLGYINKNVELTEIGNELFGKLTNYA